jgi:hypothetical protein
MSTFVKEKTTLVMEVEPTSGEAVTPLTSAHHNIKFFDVTVSPEIETYANEFALGRHSKGPATMGKRKVTFTAKASMLTSGTAGTEPKLAKAFKACGQDVTTVGGTSNTYWPNAAKDEGNLVTATIWAILVPSGGTDDAVIIKGKGCMGNCVISMDSLGAPLVAQFTFTGAFEKIEDGSALAMASDDNQDTGYAPTTIGSVIKFGENERQQVSKFSLDFGNTIELDQDPQDETGYAAAYIAKREPKLMLNTKLKRLADDAHYDRWIDGEEASFTLTTAESNHGLRYTIRAPMAQIMTMPLGNNGEEWAWDQTYELHENTSNDAHSIILDAPPAP